MTAARHGFRPVEAVLMAIAGSVAMAAAASPALAAHEAVRAADLLPAASVIGAYAALHALLSWRAADSDRVLVPLLALFAGLSLAIVRRLAPDFGAAELRWQLLAVVVVAAAALGPFEPILFQRYRYSWAIGGILLVAGTILFGRTAVGAPAGSPRLWLGFGALGFQPSEVMKFVLIVFLAGYIDDRRELLSERGPRIAGWRLPPLPYLAPMVVMLGLSLGLLVVQRDLGAALLMFVITLGMIYLATLRADVVVVALGAFALGATYLHRHAQIVATRVAIWLDPWASSQTAGYQLVQGLLAVASGGVLGTGLGLGQPTIIPAVHTDYVFAAIVEELGLAGGIAVLALYGVLAWRGMRIALDARRSFDAHLAAGLTLGFVFQEAIIVGGNLRLMPLTGITLPFLSYGGSSLLVCAASAGLLLRISRSRASDDGAFE
ncbi:MAG: FtsW/RodA/SpoVE family cell cycle protein [Ardenticatenales bacterium]